MSVAYNTLNVAKNLYGNYTMDETTNKHMIYSEYDIDHTIDSNKNLVTVLITI